MLPRAEPAWCRVARAQHGVISRRQLVATGLSPAQIHTLISKGLLQRQAPAVYRSSAARASFEAALWVAGLATGGVLGGSAAAYWWDLVDHHEGPIQLYLPRQTRISALPGVRLTRRDLPAGAVTLRRGMPVLSRPHAALDHAASLPLGAAAAFVDRCLQRGWATRADLVRRLATPQRGNPRLRTVAAALLPGAEAESERLLHRLLRGHGISGWVANHRIVVAGTVRARVDLAFVRQRIAIEVDGFAYHSASGAFQRDRSRQNLLTLLGWTVLRFTWSDLTERPGAVVRTVRAALSTVESGRS